MFLLLYWDDQVQGGWVLEGQKRWIGNSTFADLLVIFARNTTSNQINGYVICCLFCGSLHRIIGMLDICLSP